MMIIRGSQLPKGAGNVLEAESVSESEADPLQVRATGEFADYITAGTVPSIRAIRATLHVGQPRAQQVRAYLAATVGQQQAS
jgi:hypothetical protein